MKQIKGGRCLTILALLLLGGLVTVFVVTIVATQFIAGTQKDAAATLGPVRSLIAVTDQALSTRLQPTTHPLVQSTLADFGVTIDAPGNADTAPQTGSPQPSAALTSSQPGGMDQSNQTTNPATATFTATPTPSPIVGELGLGTPSFPLTLTMQHAQDQTRVAGRLNSINATATEDSRQSQLIFATLTAAAQSKRK